MVFLFRIPNFPWLVFCRYRVVELSTKPVVVETGCSVFVVVVVEEEEDGSGLSQHTRL